jgi:hypothetical protein
MGFTQIELNLKISSKVFNYSKNFIRFSTFYGSSDRFDVFGILNQFLLRLESVWLAKPPHVVIILDFSYIETST